MRPVCLLVSTLVLALAACGGKVGNGPCEGSSQDPICDQSCGADNPCPEGFYCGDDGTCNAECTSVSGCTDAEYCRPDGMCEPLIDADCPNVTLSGERTVPVVQLLLDQSGSMDAAFGGTIRWEGMKDALLDQTDGVIVNTQASVIFGASLYTNNRDTDPTCPRITSTPERKLNNYDQIDDLLNDNTYDADTPTGDSIDKIVDDFLANPVPSGQTPIILLATDGEPDTCEDGDDTDGGRIEAVAAATRAYDNGIRLYILSVGEGQISAGHLQDMANAGTGQDLATGMAPYTEAGNPAELTDQLLALVEGQLSCELTLDGVIDQSQAASGTVTVNGEEKTFNVDWEIVDGDTIRLIGQACDDLLNASDPTVEATFPCGVVVD